MRDKFILVLNDEEITLYKGSYKKEYKLKEGIEMIQSELKSHFFQSPKVPSLLLIDRHHQDLKEDTLPPLLFWDRHTLLSYKKKEWGCQENFHSYHFFKQDGKLFLQWINISLNDPLSNWALWIKSLPNPCEGIRFVSIEGAPFLKKYGSFSDNYQLMIYKISKNVRFVIFKNKRLLLYRSFTGEDDLRTSLHFLSRLYPDIYEKLQILNFIPDITLTFPRVMTSPEPSAFFDFLAQQKTGILSLKINTSRRGPLLRKGTEIFFICSIISTGFFVYQSWRHQHEINMISAQITQLASQLRHKKLFLKNKNVNLLRSALIHYNHLQSQIRFPFKTFATLAIILDKHNLKLQKLVWSNERAQELDMYFLSHNHKESILSAQFRDLIHSLREVFPQTHIQIIEAPLKSAPHQTYQYPLDHSLPTGHIKIVGL